MATTQSSITAPKVQLEDPLAYLPRSAVKAYRKGEVIYGEADPLECLHLVLHGSVMVSRTTSRGKQVIIDVYQPDEFFGETALLGAPACSEESRAVEDSRVMSWTREDVEQVILRQPRLALALVQVVVQRTAALAQRIESLCSENAQQRLVRLLFQFAHRTGTLEQDGRIRMKPITHQVMSRYLGTTREVISASMNRLKRLGYVRYSRAGIIIDCRSLQTLIPTE